MFFSLSKVLIFLTDPLFYILLFAFIGFIRFKQRLFLVLFLAFYLISTPFVSQKLIYFLEHLKTESFVESQKYDAAIVLGGMIDLNTSSHERIEFKDAVDRILTGIDLQLEGKTKYLVIAGGEGSLFQKGRSEAILLKRFALKTGVAEDAILLDTTSKNTHENAINTAEILNKYKLEKTVLITSAFHMFRANGCFQKVGINPDLLPVDFNAKPRTADFRDFLPSSSALKESNRFIHEALGIIAYGITGRAKYL